MRMGRPRTNEDKVPMILKLLDEKVTERKICEKLGVSKGKVWRVKVEFRG